MTMLKLDMEDNTMKDLYCMLDKRKSVRKANGILTDDDLKIVHEALNNATSLYPDIKLIWEIVKAEETTSKIGEYEILIYSEIKDDNSHLLNIGYLFGFFVENINKSFAYYFAFLFGIGNSF